MMDSRRRIWAPSLVLALVAVAGCARDGAYEPQGSLKDPPKATVPAPAPRSLASAKLPVKRILQPAPVKTEAPAAPPPVRAAAAPPASPPPPALDAPAKTSTPQAAAAPKAPPAASSAPQPARRPPVSGPQLLDEGRLLFKAGEVLAARERYVAALSAPLPDVLLELARTYDPNYLDQLPKSDADADLERARALYDQAASLGSKLAEQDLARLQGSKPTTPR